jgi:hypothetical protein
LPGRLQAPAHSTMAWNLRPLRRSQTPPPAAPPASPDAASARPTEISAPARDQLLTIFLRLSAVLHLTAHIAEQQGKHEHHAALAARLAIFRARVQAGENSGALAEALTAFGHEFQTFVTGELLYRSR